MKAAVFEKIGTPLTVQSVADPIPDADQVILAVKNVGICGSDLHWTALPGFLQPGAILGHEFSGTVIAAPAGKPALAGRRVTALPMFSCWHCADCKSGHPFSCNKGELVGLTRPGAFADFVAVDPRMIQLLPAGVSFEEGALIEPLAVAHHAVMKAGALTGKNILVIGAGPIGVAVTLFTARAGARQIIVSEPSPERRERARQVGATAVINPFEQNPAQEFRKIAGGHPDVVMVCNGVPGMIDAAIGLADKRGLIVVVGACLEQDHMLPENALVKNLTITFSGGYEAENFAAAIDAIAAGQAKVDPVITGRFDLEKLPEMFESLRAPNDHCKVLVAF